MFRNFRIKLIAIVLVIVTVFSLLVACNSFDDVNHTTTLPTTSTTKPTTTKPTTTKPTTTRPTTTRPTTSTSATTRPNPNDDCYFGHIDSDTYGNSDYGWCDVCGSDVVETIDFYNFNDLHGKFEDSDDNNGVDELTTYLEERKGIDDHVVILSSGDMWQGGSASNSTKGKIITDWMNYLGFEAMALGNHEFDWGQDAIRENANIADFPLLAINIYDNATGKRVDYCEPSIMIERGGVQIGIIGAIGNCYSSISSAMTEGIHFKVGSELTSLVKAESEKLQEAGADIIVYLIHDGTEYDAININDYYDQSLSSGGYVDIVFSAHTHSYYIVEDSYGVPHLQGGGDNKIGMTHVEVDVNFANGDVRYNLKNYVQHSQCQNLTDSPIVEELLNKYWDEIGWIYENLGYNASDRNSSTIKATIARLYYDAGVAKWGNKYNIVLAGGQLNIRSPYTIYAGYVQYSDLQTVLTFDNPLYLCRIKGSDLKSKFLNNSEYTKYTTITARKVNDNEYYYIIADSWTALYDWANCEVVEIYDETTFARDLLAEYIKAGNWSK